MQSTTNLRFRSEINNRVRDLRAEPRCLSLFEAQRQAVKEALLSALSDPDNVADVLHDLIEWSL